VIDEFHDRHSLRQLTKAADVVAVVMRDDHVIDLRKAGVVRGVHNPAGIPGRRHRPGIPGVE
jgi:hypothetical protein